LFHVGSISAGIGLLLAAPATKVFLHLTFSIRNIHFEKFIIYPALLLIIVMNLILVASEIGSFCSQTSFKVAEM
jgi:hypothetical protein